MHTDPATGVLAAVYPLRLPKGGIVTEPLDMDDGYRRALGVLWTRSAYERGFISDPFGSAEAGQRGLRRVRALLTMLGDPDRAQPVIHVAGSKGKGSTAAMVASALAAAGHRTGLFTSPHLHSFRERIAVDGEAISRSAFAALAARVETAALALESADPALGTVTTFEFLTAMGFLAFAEAGCDVAVAEVGLGGDFDATNVVDPLVSVIARIDLEHTAVLGDTLPAIAAAKAGIIKTGRPVVVGANAPAVLEVFEATADRAGSPLLFAGRNFAGSGPWTRCTLTGPWGTWRDLSLALPGAHQVENAATAAAALWAADRAGVAVGEDAVRAGFAGVHWPGRFERLNVEGVRVVLDGAHTPASAAAIADAMADAYPGERAVVVLGISADKDADAIVAALAPAADRVIATAANTPRAAAIDLVAAAARAAGLPVESAPTVAAAMAMALDRAASQHAKWATASSGTRPGLVLATGSLYLVGEAREALGLAAPDPPWGPSSA